MGSFRRIAFTLLVVTATSATLLVLRPAAAAPGDLDRSFGSGGTVDTPIGSTSLATSVALQPDGKVVAGGVSYPGGSLTLARYETNGVLDESFGSGGVVTGPCCGASAIALQPDGKVVLAGYGSRANRAVFSVARYAPDGAPDGAFGAGGVATGPDGDARDLVIQPDGRIVAVGAASEMYAFQLARFDANGALDSSFGSAGTVRTLLGSAASAEAVLVQPDGKVVAAGASVPGIPPPPPPPPPAPPPPPPPGPPPLPWQMTLVRYNADGHLDPSFGSNGVVRTTLGFSSRINALALQPDGRIVAAGEADERPRGTRRVALSRYRPDGSLDPTFGTGGITTSTAEPGGWGGALALQPDRMIVVAGTYGVARYRDDGRPDRTFGPDGISGGRPSLTALAVAVQQDGRIVTAGFRTMQARSGFALNRYFGKPPTTIAAAPGVVPYGRTVLIQGTVPGAQSGTRVRILKRDCYDLTTRAVMTTSTRPAGRWRARVRPGSRTAFQAEVDVASTSPLVVRVRPTVELSKISRGLFQARLVSDRSLAGEKVVLQRLAGKRWVNSKRVVLRRIAKRGSAVISGRTFAARNTAERRLRLSYPGSGGDYACYAKAASRPIRG